MSTRRVESFLLRVVVYEDSCDQVETLRGRIKHISTGGERHFQHIEEAIAFIRDQFSSDFTRLTVDIEEGRAPS